MRSRFLYILLAVTISLTISQAFCSEAKTKKCPYKHSEKNQESWRNSALNYSVKARDLLIPLLPIQNTFSYFIDESYIDHFPFCLYNVVAVPGQGTFFVNDINDYIKNILRAKKAWEPGLQTLIKKYVKEGSIALDIGAHIGTHTVTLSNCVGQTGTVIAFEPNRTIHRELCYNLTANLCSNVFPLRCAVGKDHGVIEVVTPLAINEGGSYVIEAKGGWNTAAILPLDAFHLDNVSFIKIDVENMEADVLDGAVETILRCRPVMLIEIQGNAERPRDLGEDSEQMAAISKAKIEGLGYSLTRLGQSNDFLAIPL